jgi:hypothetical protein
MSRLAARGVVIVSLVLASSVAFAQGTPAPRAAAAPAPQAGASAPASPAQGAASGDADPAKPGEPKKPTREAGGYSFSDKPAPRRARGVARRAAGPVATLPGFEQLPDGGSRVFVHVSSQVPVEERKAQGSVTYVLKGAHVQFHNNTNALVTVHFNTPVARARLVPSGGDLLLQIDLRAATLPTWKMNEAQDKSATLVIDFAKGDFLASGAADDAAATEAGAPGARPPRTRESAPARSGKGGGKGRTPAPKAPAPAPKAPGAEPPAPGPNP